MKKLLPLLLALLMLLALPVTAADAAVRLEGENLSVPASLVGGTTYVPLRAFCDAVGGTVAWDAQARKATVTGALSLTVSDLSRTALCAGRSETLAAPCYIAGGTLYVPIRALAAALGSDVYWLPAAKTAVLEEDALLWLARIIEAEAGGESARGKLAVGNVVLNRVASGDFPATVRAVIFDRQNGCQFTPVANGTVWCTPSPSSLAAAQAALAGESAVGPCLYFFNPRTATAQSWIVQNRAYYASIGSHNFYR